MEGRVFGNFQKIFSKLQKFLKSFPKISKHVLNMFWGKIFEKFFCSVFPGGSSFRKFSKKNIFKIPKMPKSVPKSIQACFRVIFSKKKFMPSVPWRVEFSKIFKKKFSKFKNAQNRSQKSPKMF